MTINNQIQCDATQYHPSLIAVGCLEVNLDPIQMGSFTTGSFWQTDLAQGFYFDPFLEDVPPLVGARDFYTFVFFNP